MNMFRSIDEDDRTIADASEELLSMVDGYQRDQDGYLLGLRLSRLMSVLRLHFAREDSGMVLSDLIREDRAFADDLRRRADEARQVGETLERYAARYAAGVGESAFGAFRHETLMLVGRLAEHLDTRRGATLAPN